MSVRVVTARELKGPAWSARYPQKAEDLWVFAIVDGRKKKRRIGPPTDENRVTAERKRREWEVLIERKALGKAQMATPLFKDAVREFAKHGLSHRSWKTRSGREYQLGVMEREFGELSLDTIDAEMLCRFCSEMIEGGKSIRTANGYIDAVSQLYQFHARTIPKLENPALRARAMVTEGIDTTAAYRAANEGNCNPLTPEEMAKLLAALRTQKNRDLEMTVLLCYETGLRLGEAFGLQWGDVWWGDDETDTTRRIHIQRSRQGNRVGLTKSGRSRKVSISVRLRARLMERFMELGSPGPDRWVIEQNWAKNARDRLARIARTAKIRPLKFKDLRDTYASTLCSHGIVLRWISKQLGHGSVSVTERHYASFLATEGYQNPWIVPEGMLPSDMLAELESRVPQDSPRLPQIAEVK